MSWCDPVHSSDVHDFQSLANYACYTTGIPYPANRDIAKAQKQCKLILDEYPQLTWQSLCKVADWSRAKKRRFARMHTLFSQFRDAYAAGYLPELDPNTYEAGDEVETGIVEALQVETDDYWRSVLLRSSGPDARQRVFYAWREARLTDANS
jgi:hypothetical protein